MAAIGGASECRDFPHPGLDVGTTPAMHHGKEVIRPLRQVPDAQVAVGHERQRPDAATELVCPIIRHVPHAHPVGEVAKRVVVRHDTDPADGTCSQHSPDTGHDLLGRDTNLLGHGFVGTWHQRQSGLCRDDDAPVHGVRNEGLGGRVHAASVRPTKYSSALGMR